MRKNHWNTSAQLEHHTEVWSKEAEVRGNNRSDQNDEDKEMNDEVFEKNENYVNNNLCKLQISHSTSGTSLGRGEINNISDIGGVKCQYFQCVFIIL